MRKNILIVGAGFSGCVLANELAKKTDLDITVWDERAHIGGNCYTKRDERTGVMEHKYGPHIFNTDKGHIWNYINELTELVPFVNRVKALYRDNIYSMPVNLHTINQFFDKSFDPAEAKAFISDIAEKEIDEPANFEEQALKFIGKDLYKAFFYGYTKKQWGCEPTELPASILKRLPVRFNYNDNYYNNPFQGIPRDGYTVIFEKLLDHERIILTLDKKFSAADSGSFDHVFFTGPIDSFFAYRHGRLSYRTVLFERHEAEGDHQGNAVINYCDESTPFTRIHEHKHFTPWENHEKTIYFKEYSKETTEEDIPYYPKRLPDDMELLGKYVADAKQSTAVSFLGRLGTYRYMDMHHVIDEALSFSDEVITAVKHDKTIPVFPAKSNL